MLRRYLALRSSSGFGYHVQVHLLVASAAEIRFRWDSHPLDWFRPGLPLLSGLAGPVQHFRSAVFNAWREKVAADLCDGKGFSRRARFWISLGPLSFSARCQEQHQLIGTVPSHKIPSKKALASKKARLKRDTHSKKKAQGAHLKGRIQTGPLSPPRPATLPSHLLFPLTTTLSLAVTARPR